jgi:RNA polymerase sigma-70 factor (ECF subfamily)
MARDVTEIWQQVHGSLRGFIAKRVADDAAVDDILQEVFLRVHRQLDRLNDPDRLVAWLYQIARNAIVDFYRSPGRRHELPVGLADELEPSAARSIASDEQPSQVHTELAACLRPMLARLSKDYREAVTMVELDGFTQMAAAKRLGLSVSGMKSRVQRGRKQLKQMLEACCLIQLDGRKGIAGYEVLNRDCDPCNEPRT